MSAKDSLSNRPADESRPAAIRNWREAEVAPGKSVLFNKRERAITWLVPSPAGPLVDRRTTAPPAGKVRISDLPMPREVDCLQTIEFVHHSIVPPGEIHAPEAHLHPDAEEVFYVVAGNGQFRLGDDAFAVGPGDFVYVPPGLLHELRNTGDTDLEFVDFSARVGAGAGSHG